MPGSTLLTIDMITREAVRLFKNSNLFLRNIDTQYDNQFATDGAKIGDTLRIRLPVDYVVFDGPAMQLQSTTAKYTSLTVDDQKHIAIPFTSAERTMDIDDYSDNYIQPIINNLAGKVAVSIMNVAEDACNVALNVDGGGVLLSPTADTFLRANAILDDNSADQMTRRLVNDPTTDARTVTALAGLFNPTPEISAQFRSGQMKSGLGYERWFRDQTVIKHTTGTFSAGGAVNLGGQSGNVINVSAITGTLKRGDFITFDGVNAVNYVNKQNLGTLRQFVVTADVIAGGTAISIYPALTPSVNGMDVQYQSVDLSPVNGAQMRLVMAASTVCRKSLAFVEKAVTMATADLVLPKKAVEEAARAQYDGVSMRILTDYLPNSDQLATRVDVLFGKKTIRPEWLCVVADKI